jgi:hypothetical protein
MRCSFAASPVPLVSLRAVSTSIDADTADALPFVATRLDTSPDDAEAPPGIESDLHALVAGSVAGPSGEDIAKVLGECHSVAALRKIVSELILPHPHMFDLLNGHGYRVFVFKKLSNACARLNEVDLWWKMMVTVRTMGFTLSRTFVATALDALKRYVTERFKREGRNPQIAANVLSKCRHLCDMAVEDGVALDWVIYTRLTYVLTTVVAVFDRQNMYRSSWPAGDVPRREGIVTEWVVSHKRCADFDAVVGKCNAFLDELLDEVRHRTNARPPFSFMLRLADYYFATDNFHAMLAVVEDCDALGVSIAESTTAKLMQMACAFNIEEVPRLFHTFRAAPPQCLVAAPDMSRMMLYYARAGGGRPCPACGEPFNHRHVGLEVWQATPAAQRGCALLAMARGQKGVLEDHAEYPGNADFSRVAFGCWDMSVARSVQWNVVEWRAFLCCCVFSPRAMEAAALLQRHLPRPQWDDFLATQFMRVHRHNAPEQMLPVLQDWSARSVKISPLVLQEAALGVAYIGAAEARLATMRFLVGTMRRLEVYTMPYTQRTLQTHLKNLEAASALTDEERKMVAALSALSPRQKALVDVKDSCTDVTAGSSLRHKTYDV